MSRTPSKKVTDSSTVRLPDRLKSEVAKALGHYVYALIDPRNDQIFYVGKGQGDRFLAHERDAVRRAGQSAKAERIRSILDAGLKPRVDIIRHGLIDEGAAFLVESVTIDALSPGLTNIVSGYRSARAPLDELKLRYAAPELSVDAPPALLIRLGRWQPVPAEIERGYTRSGHGWRPGMRPVELADSTRAWWKISARTIERKGVAHAVAVVDGVTRAVFTIDEWIAPRSDRRRAFRATPVLSGVAYDAYHGEIGVRVPIAQGSQNPVTYWPP